MAKEKRFSSISRYTGAKHAERSAVKHAEGRADVNVSIVTSPRTVSPICVRCSGTHSRHSIAGKQGRGGTGDMNYQATEAASKNNGDGGVCSFLERWDSQEGLQTPHQEGARPHGGTGRVALGLTPQGMGR